MSKQVVENSRIILLFGMVIVLAIMEGGQALYYVSTVGIVINLILHALQRPAFFRLITVWQMGFLLFIGLDGLLDYQSISYRVPENALETASKYLNLANAMVLLGHALIFRERGFGQTPWYNRSRLATNPLLPWFLGLLYVLFVAHIVPFAYIIATQGRVAVHSGDIYLTRSISYVVLYNLALLTGIMLPALMAYYLIWVRRLHMAFGPTRLHLGPIPLAVMLSLPIFATQVLTGVRYPLLLAAMGLFVVIYARRPLTLKTLRQLSLVGLLLLSVMVFMYQFRVYGVDSFEVETFAESLDFRGVVPSENVVATMARMVDYFPYYGYQHGAEHTAMLLFWVPRAVWPEKPTQLGYWFIRAYGITGFGAYHTTASSFADLAYADFGFAIGIALMLLLGMGLGLAERWTARIISLQGNPYIVMVAVLYGLTFFAVRQLSTVYFLLFGALAINLVFLALIKVRPKVVQEQASSAAYDPKHAMRQPLSGRG